MGNNTVLFTCETSTEVLEDRLDALNTDTGNKKAGRESSRCRFGSQSKNQAANSSSMRPHKATHAEGNRAEAEPAYQLRPSASTSLSWTYLDIMARIRHFEDELKAQGHIAEELRAIAGIYNIPVLTATQVNREGAKREVISGTNISVPSRKSWWPTTLSRSLQRRQKKKTTK
jgi:hypothetical protein